MDQKRTADALVWKCETRNLPKTTFGKLQQESSVLCNTSLDTEDFAELYAELHFLKENPEAVKRAGSIRKAIEQTKVSQE